MTDYQYKPIEHWDTAPQDFSTTEEFINDMEEHAGGRLPIVEQSPDQVEKRGHALEDLYDDVFAILWSRLVKC